MGPVLAQRRPPSIAPFIPSPEQLDEAKSVAKKAALIGTAIATARYLAPKFPTTTAKLTHFLTGFEITPGKGVKVTSMAVLWFGPQPVGVVPPRMYGLPPEMANPKFYARGVGLLGGREVNRQNIVDRLIAEKGEAARLYALNARLRFSDELLDKRIAELQAMTFRAPTLQTNFPQFDELDQLVILVAERSQRKGEIPFSANPTFALEPKDRPALQNREPEPPDPEQSDTVNQLNDLVRFIINNPPDP